MEVMEVVEVVEVVEVMEDCGSHSVLMSGLYCQRSGVQTNLRRRTDPKLLQCSETADAKYATRCVCVCVFNVTWCQSSISMKPFVSVIKTDVCSVSDV